MKDKNIIFTVLILILIILFLINQDIYLFKKKYNKNIDYEHDFNQSILNDLCQLNNKIINLEDRLKKKSKRER